MGIKGVILEYHCDIPVLRGDIVHFFAVNEELTFGDILKTCDHAESGGFTTTGWAYQYDKFLVLDYDVGIVYSADAAIIHLRNAFNFYFCHLLASLLGYFMVIGYPETGNLSINILKITGF
uniref:Uncharacterized protein n=1 Tax=uncultured bacterium contig00064 TaxID=1181547 RepID=A0A806KPM6_9BACT|nr:hypothetical protein [uncultured bacterium contig00064]